MASSSQLTGVDVITVSDFRCPVRQVQMWRTLFLLASWRHLGLHLEPHTFHVVCIGTPPAPVEAMAAACGARLTVAEPFAGNRTGTDNKLRGLEITPSHSRFLLLDNDMVLLRPLDCLLEDSNSLGATVAAVPRVPESLWRTFFEFLETPVPSERVPCSNWVMRIPKRGEKFPGQREEMKSMIPQFNSSVVHAPWACGLGQYWAKNQRELLHHFRDRDSIFDQYLDETDQVAFTIALHRCRTEGWNVFPLPNLYNTYLDFLFRGTATLAETACLHLTRHSFQELDHCVSTRQARRKIALRCVKRLTSWSQLCLTARHGTRNALKPHAPGVAWSVFRLLDNLLMTQIEPVCGRRGWS